jgi:hypothetical protein
MGESQLESFEILKQAVASSPLFDPSTTLPNGRSF